MSLFWVRDPISGEKAQIPWGWDKLKSVVFRNSPGVWGKLSLFPGSPENPKKPEKVTFLGNLVHLRGKSTLGAPGPRKCHFFGSGTTFSGPGPLFREIREIRVRDPGSWGSPDPGIPGSRGPEKCGLQKVGARPSFENFRVLLSSSDPATLAS